MFFKVKKIEKETNPKWNETYTTMCEYPLSGDLNIQILDKGLLKVKQLGKVSLSLSEKVKMNEILETEIPLEGQGSVHLELYFKTFYS